MDSNLRRAGRFVISGSVATGVAYVSFVMLLPFVHYTIAATTSWAASVVCGFVLNRRFTFRITGKHGRTRDFGAFLVGAGLQYLLAMGGYWLLLEKMHLGPSVSFALNLCATTAFSYGFLNMIAFRRAIQR